MRRLVLSAAAILLPECRLPPSVTYTSYVADVFSYLTTEKTVTDHGISMELQFNGTAARTARCSACWTARSASRRWRKGFWFRGVSST